MNVHQGSISRLWDRYRQVQSAQDRPRSGIPRITTAAQDRYIRVLHLRHRAATATNTAGRVPGLRRASAQTIENRLREAGLLYARRPRIDPVLRRQHRRLRVRCCTNVQDSETHSVYANVIAIAGGQTRYRFQRPPATLFGDDNASTAVSPLSLTYVKYEYICIYN